MCNPKVEEWVLISLKPELLPPVSLLPKRLLSVSEHNQMHYIEVETAWCAFRVFAKMTTIYLGHVVCLCASTQIQSSPAMHEY